MFGRISEKCCTSWVGLAGRPSFCTQQVRSLHQDSSLTPWSREREPSGSSGGHHGCSTQWSWALGLREWHIQQKVRGRPVRTKCGSVHLYCYDCITSLSAGAQKVHNVVVVTKVAKNFELWHQGFALLWVSACCGAAQAQASWSQNRCHKGTRCCDGCSWLTFQHFDSHPCDIIVPKTICRCFYNLSESSWPKHGT